MGRPAIPVVVRRRFWAAIRSGMVVAEAAAGTRTVGRKSGYRASLAKALADQRARRPKARLLAVDD